MATDRSPANRSRPATTPVPDPLLAGMRMPAVVGLTGLAMMVLAVLLAG